MSTGSRFVLPYQTVISVVGVPLPGALLYFYASETDTPLDTYSDEGLTTPNTNPVQADAAGMFPNIWLSSAPYKVVLTDSLDNQIWTADPVAGIGVSSQTQYYSFATTAALLTAFGSGVVLANGTQASTSGRTISGDGGGGVFEYNSSDTTTADNSGTIRVDAQNRRWYCLNETIVPQLFGAIGDGATDDSAAISAAVAATAGAGLPLRITGNLVFLVDTISLPSNTAIIGDNNATLKLKDDASGSIFFWGTATYTNITVSRLILDGNFGGQTVPKDLVNSVFLGNSSTVVTNSLFSDIVVNDAAGEVFGFHVSFQLCNFDDIVVLNHYQTAFDFNPTTAANNKFSRIVLINAGTVRGSAYGIALGGGGNNTARDVYIQLGIAGVTTDNIGFEFDGNYNAIDNVFIDCATGAHNWGISTNTGTGNRFSGVTVYNAIDYFAFELLNQTDLLLSNIQTISVLGGIYIQSGTRVVLTNFIYVGADTTSGHRAFWADNRGSGSVASNAISVSNIQLQDGYEGVVLEGVSGAKFANVGIVRFATSAFQTVGSAHTNANVDVTNMHIDTANVSLNLSGLDGGVFSGIDAISLNQEYLGQFACSNLHFSGLRGILTPPASSIGFHGWYEGKLVGSYSFSVDGGSVGTIDTGDTLPSGAVVSRFTYNVRGTLTSSTSMAQVAIGVVGTLGAFKAATVISDGSWGTGAWRNGIEDNTVGNFFGNGSDANVSLAISVEALTGGVVEWAIDYFVPAN